MGLTREQIRKRTEADYRRTEEYRRVMAPVWQKRAEERIEKRAAIGMLLDAEWNIQRQMFIKTVKDEAGGLPVHWEECYDADGKRIR